VVLIVARRRVTGGRALLTAVMQVALSGITDLLPE
jgi:hypothetical protein